MQNSSLNLSATTSNSNSNFTKIVTPDTTTRLPMKENLTNKINNSNNTRSLKLKGYVGFDRLAHQHVNKYVKDGFAFNILCIGETGIGKSTLMDTLFNTSFNLEPTNHNNQKVTLNSNTFDLKENNINLKLTVIETCGYGDQINKENSHEEILKYINEQFETFVQDELGLKRTFKQINDTRVHLCLYFISPTGHSLKAIDLTTMKALDRKVNIIPIIAKADTICKNELIQFKKRIMNELNANNVNIYQFPINESELNINNLNASANNLYPMAVIGSTSLVKIGNKLTKGRQYEWGCVSVENELHCDFVKLKDMILSTNMFDLIEATHMKHYHLYRINRLREIGFRDEEDKKESDGQARTIQDVYCMKKAEMDEEIQRKENEIKEEFVKRVKEKELDIKEQEKELNSKYNQWKMEQNEWRERIEYKRRELEDQMREFSERKFTLDKLKLSTLSSVGKHSKKK